MKQIQFISRSIEDTNQIAATILPLLPDSAVIALTGDLGSGKTAFTQALAKALHLGDSITSPTFTLINEYETQHNLHLVHSDFYRLSEEEIVDLGITDYFKHPNTLVVVEWANYLPRIFPPTTLWLDFKYVNESKRVITCTTHSPELWNKLVKPWITPFLFLMRRSQVTLGSGHQIDQVNGRLLKCPLVNLLARRYLRRSSNYSNSTTVVWQK